MKRTRSALILSTIAIAVAGYAVISGRAEPASSSGATAPSPSGGAATSPSGSAATSAAAASADSAPGVPVVVAPVSTRDLPIRLNGIGTVTPLQVVNVKVRVDGQLDRVAFKEGQTVKAGDLLAQIDPRPFRAQLQQAEGNLQRDQAQLANAKVDFARFTKLAAAGAAPSQNVDTLKSQVAALEATVLADQAMVETARLQLSFTTIQSPIAGRVGLRQVDPGSIVHATDTNGLVTVTQMRPIAVLFSLPQDALPDVLDEMKRRTLPIAIDTRDGTRHVADGELVFVDSQIDTTTGQVRLKAIFKNSDSALWPGELVAARLLLRTDRGALVVPAQAVQRGQDNLFVYVLKPDKTVEPRVVATGPTVDGYTALTSGLAAGELVVVAGQSRIAKGTRVAPRPAAP